MLRTRLAPSAAALLAIQTGGIERARLWDAIRISSLTAAFRLAGLAFPSNSPPPPTPPERSSLNKPMQVAMSEYIRRVRPSLPKFVELVRGQTAADYRSNKALLPSVLSQCCGYEHLDTLLQSAQDGVRVHLLQPLLRQQIYPRNHPSASARLNVLRANIRKEQYQFRCLAVDADIIKIWPELFIGPFSVVDKGSRDPRITGRVIHDLSHPENASVNSHTGSTDVPKPTFEHCSSVAREILKCQREDPRNDVRVMAGDVASAYRNACTHSGCVYMIGGHIPEDNAIVIDMSAAFGWTGSAGTYSVLGGAVAFIHGSIGTASKPTGFYNYHWVDDHINVAFDIGPRCADVERSLRFAMTAAMGPSAVNDRKFTTWSTRQKVLGLIFDTKASTVAVPSSKIAKAQRLVAHAYHANTLTRSEFRSLLGSLRHVATCVRPAQAFLQRLSRGEQILHRCATIQYPSPCVTTLPGGGTFSTRLR